MILKLWMIRLKPTGEINEIYRRKLQKNLPLTFQVASKLQNWTNNLQLWLIFSCPKPASSIINKISILSASSRVQKWSLRILNISTKHAVLLKRYFHTINKFDKERIILFGVEATRQHVAKEQIRWSIKNDSQTSSLRYSF